MPFFVILFYLNVSKLVYFYSKFSLLKVTALIVNRICLEKCSKVYFILSSILTLHYNYFRDDEITMSASIEASIERYDSTCDLIFSLGFLGIVADDPICSLKPNILLLDS
jgi:hypothetical protein